MGLSAFEDCSRPHPYCSTSVDRSLTTRLIETSNAPSKSSYRFAHTPEWADGLDLWPSVPICSTKTVFNRRQMDFHCELGLYLPRHEKPNSAPISFKNVQLTSKLPTNHLPPERIQLLLKKEKDLLSQHDRINQSVTIDNLPPPSVPTNTFRQSNSLENSPCLSRRQLTPPSQLNQDALKCLLKEHLTSLLTRGASTINANQSLINAATVDFKQQSKLIDERFSKLDEFISTQQTKPNQTSSIIFHPRSTLGLTITPVDLTPQKNLQTVTLEKMAQQRTSIHDSDTSSIASSRPSTQPVAHSIPQRVRLKRNVDTTNSASGEMASSNESLNTNTKLSEQIQHHRKGHSMSRSSSKTSLHRTTVPTTTTTIELLPPIISGKRLHIPIANHRHL